jgi:serine/threonine protein phosphatase 1
MMLRCIDTSDEEPWEYWMFCGGGPTLESFGLRPDLGEYDHRWLADALCPDRIEWLRSLKLYHIAEPYLFVHAGLVPGRSLPDQKEKDLLWIRDEFLDSEKDHGFTVVHGHTPSRKPELRLNRIGIDTGACFGGALTAVVLGETSGPRFLSVTQD